ncbi:Os01g0731201 [Oryza sativa Japonica Group]|uniref:Os01g0731201 protein n=1 Tax=Oryza sativa subsp. japonica TaxID=39947 RepID=A0A0P0V7R9_ORYSJ|nr:hypothetical protein EE612_005522 [Oryza sativa]KAF2952140.1 hypothetical protein DAI22_01g313800 [Oryza sativa Japonica Group]BAS74188.1 Os01g0731201 [Oryza sativa Japonica Group]
MATAMRSRAMTMPLTCATVVVAPSTSSATQSPRSVRTMILIAPDNTPSLPSAQATGLTRIHGAAGLSTPHRRGDGPRRHLHRHRVV